jgi:hypothetical protein
VYLRNQKALWRKGATARSPWRCSRLYQQGPPVWLHIIIHANDPGRIHICQLNYYDCMEKRIRIPLKENFGIITGTMLIWFFSQEQSFYLCVALSCSTRTSPTKSWTPERRYASNFELLHNLVQIRQCIFLILFFWRKTWDNPNIRNLHIIQLLMAMKPSEEAQKESSSSSSWDN